MPDLPAPRDLIALVRAPAALSVPGDAIAGAAAAGTLGPRTGGLAAASICLYWAGMAANDWADRDLDAIERPERPVPSGRVTPGQALAVASGLTAAGLGIAALAGGRRALAVAAPLAGAVWTYDLWAKDTAAGPPMMALCRGLDVLLGASGGRIRAALPAALTMAAHTATVTALSRREVSGGSPALPGATLAATAAVAAAAARRHGASAGPAAAARRQPVSRGWRAAPAGWPAAACVALAGWYAAWYGSAQVRAAADPSASRIRSAVGAGITGMAPLQGALTARAGNPVTGMAVAAAAPVAGLLTKRVSAT
ncbi:transferase [Actinoplanes sp. OR16]|uniref:SCO3242 family prenyltransferase n=1 Tax=Actinoplanes sp. OR16 TaxID=946334 RepID=UPI000F7006C4|nr:UbiA family prenyltransferase [Actinoplanes sp. OR16]BBH69795.1 transferase [Actinoplanes sp. OR16]